MLYSIDSDGSLRRITQLPHREFFDACRHRLTDEQFQNISEKVRSLIQGGEIHTSSWMPGADWTGSRFQDIYDHACRGDFNASAQFFGLVVWQVIMDHEEDWSFGRYEKNGIPIEGMTYFRVTRAQAGRD